MPKQLTNWLDEFVQNGADKDNVPDWSTQSGGGGSYTPGNGINIVGNEISVDTQTIATKQDLNNYEPAEDAFSGDYNDLDNKPTIPDTVSGTNDGTNWTSLTVGSVTKNIPAGGGTSYTAGTGIDITNDEISVDNTVAMKTDIPDAVSGEHSGNNWTSITIGDVTKNIPTSLEDNITTIDCSSTHTVTFTNSTTPGIYKITQKYSQGSNITIKLLAAGSSRVLATIEIPGYVASPDGDACMYLIWTESYPNNNQYNQRGLYGFYNYGGPMILYGYVNYVSNSGAGSGYIEAKPITDFVNRDIISYKLSLTFTKDGADSYMDFIFSNENAISGNIDVTTFKALFNTTEALIGDKKLCDINHTVRIYNNGTYTIGDIYYDSTTQTFGTVDGTITGLTLSSITKTEKSHTIS